LTTIEQANRPKMQKLSGNHNESGPGIGSSVHLPINPSQVHEGGSHWSDEPIPRLSKIYKKARELTFLSQNVKYLYRIQMKEVSMKYGMFGEKPGLPLQDI
jgi:hypothetical protein